MPKKTETTPKKRPGSAVEDFQAYEGSDPRIASRALRCVQAGDRGIGGGRV